MKLFTFWILIVLELVYCSRAIASILMLKFNMSDGSLILEWGIAIALCGICALLTWLYCRRKKLDASKIKDHMKTGIVVGFGIVSALMVVTYIILSPWGGYFS